MEWMVIFFISWILFFLLVDWQSLKVNIWAGVFTMSMQLAVDGQAIHHGLYAVNNPVVALWGSSLLFTFGPVLVIGILISQFHPRKRLFILANVVILTTLFTLEELILLERDSVVRLNWHTHESIAINFVALAFLSWFCIVVLKKRVVN